MFFRIDNAEFEVYMNSNHILQIFKSEGNWYARTTNEEEYMISKEMAEKITGKKLVDEETEEE